MGYSFSVMGYTQPSAVGSIIATGESHPDGPGARVVAGSTDTTTRPSSDVRLELSVTDTPNVYVAAGIISGE
jgi:hypothetical protein